MRPLSIAGGVAKTGAYSIFRPILVARARAFFGRTGKRGQVMAQQEMKAANETYAGFITLLKIGSVITAIAAVVVVLLIS